MASAPKRTAGGRHVTPIGVRTGGKAWLQIHSAIAAASLEVLAEGGWGLFTVEGVAERANCSKRTVYRHYPDKESLAVAGIRLMPTFDSWARGEGSVHERIERAVNRGFLFPHYLAPVLSSALVHKDDVPALLNTLTLHVLEPRARAFDELIAEAVADGVGSDQITGSHVDALVTGLLLAEYRGDAFLNSNPKRVKVFTDLIWKIIEK